MPHRLGAKTSPTALQREGHAHRSLSNIVRIWRLKRYALNTMNRERSMPNFFCC